MANKCRIAHWKDARFDYEKYDAEAPTDIAKKINLIHKRWEAVSKVSPKHPLAGAQAVAQQRFWDRMLRIGTIVEAGRYSKNFRQALETRAVSLFAKLRGKDIASLTHEQLIQYERRARGFVANGIADLEVAKVAQRLKRTFNELTPDNLTAHQKYELMWDFIELGTQPYLVDSSMDVGQVGIQMLANKQKRVFDRATDYGIDQATQMKLAASAKELVQTNFEVIGLAQNIGVDITALKDMGYMERIFLREPKDIIEAVSNDGFIRSPKGVTPKLTAEEATASFMKGRQFFDYVPEDTETLDYLFKKAGVMDRINKVLQENDNLARLLNKNQVESVADLLEGSGEPVLLHAIINEMDEDDLSFLVESGFIHKIPWETSKVYQWMAEKYKFPFEGINQVYQSDPVRAAKMYQRQLENVAVTRGKVWGTVHGALQDGWGIPEGMVLAEPEKYKGFKKLRDAYPQKIIDEILGTDAEVNFHLDNTYVHPEVARTIRGDLELATSPIQLGLLGNVFQIFKKWSSGLMLSTPQWFGRQVIGWAGKVASYGISPGHYATHLGLYTVALVKRLLSGDTELDYAKMLNNSKKIYGGGKYTSRELWDVAVKKGLINDFDVFGERANTINPRDLGRTAREFKWFQENFPEQMGDNLKELVPNALNQLSDNLPMFKFLSWGNVLTDNLGRFTILEHIMRDNSFKIPDWVGVVPKFKDPEEAVQWTFDHVWNFDDIPRNNWTQNTFLQAIVPFVNWRIKNAQQTLLYMTEHPHLFGSYLYLNQERIDNLEEERPVDMAILNDTWVDRLDMPNWWRVPADVSGTGKDEWFMYPVANLAPHLSPISDITDLLSLTGLFEKGKLPHTRADNPYLKRNILLQRLVKEQSMPMGEAILAAITGQDNWGRDFQELRDQGKYRMLGGVEVDPEVHFYITTVVPNLKTLDNIFSYTGLAGSAPDLNEVTGEFKEGKPSWTGTIPQSSTKAQKPNFFGNAQFFLDTMGMAPSYLDIHLQAGYTISDIEKQLATGKSKLKKISTRIDNETDPKKKAELTKDYQDMVIWGYWLEIELGYFEKWRKDAGMPPTKVIKQMMKEHKSVNVLLPEAQKRAIREDIYKKYQVKFEREP